MSASSEHVVDLLDDYVHGLLKPQESDRVAGHCARCADCARALEQARRRLTLLQSVPPAEPSATLVQTTIEHIEARSSATTTPPPGAHHLGRRRWPRGLVARGLVTAHVYYANLKPSSA